MFFLINYFHISGAKKADLRQLRLEKKTINSDLLLSLETVSGLVRKTLIWPVSIIIDTFINVPCQIKVDIIYRLLKWTQIIRLTTQSKIYATGHCRFGFIRFFNSRFKIFAHTYLMIQRFKK